MSDCIADFQITNEAPSLEGLQTEFATKNERIQTLINLANKEGRDPTDAESDEIETLAAESEGLQKSIRTRSLAANVQNMATASLGRKTSPNGPDVTNAGTVAKVGGDFRPVSRNVTNGGFRSFGELVLSVRNAGRPGGFVDPRLSNAAPGTYGSEGVGADGGFLVPPAYQTALLAKITSEESLINRTDMYPLSGSNQMTFPADEGTQWGGSIQAQWVAEAGTVAPQKPALRQMTITAHKLGALVAVTDELLADASAAETFVSRKAADAIDYAISAAIISGSGVAKPLGYLNAPGTVTQTKESGQAANTILAANIEKMYSRMPFMNRNNAIWLCSQEIEPVLQTLQGKISNAAGTDFVGGYPLYMPAGGLSAASYSTLKGRPIVYHQACPGLSALGDIAFVDLREYVTLYRGLQSDMSIHFYFDAFATAFRFSVRVGGQPWRAAPITSASGNTTYSPFVVLQAR